MKRATLPILAAGLLALAGCGGSSSSSSATASSSSSSAAATSSATTTSATSASAGATTVHVTLRALAFTPPSVTAKVGDTVRWVNEDQPPHNVTYVSGPKFVSSGTLNTGGTFQIKLTAPGTIHYVCTIHPFMKATIVVSK